MSAEVMICAFDGTSRVPGASLGASMLWNTYLASSSELVVHSLALETKNSAIFCRRVRRLADEKNIRFALGGEHLVTFPLVEAQKQRHPELRLVVLDAHHDAYDHPLLTHATLFHYTQHELSVPTMIVGARYELERQTSDLTVVSGDELALDSIDATIARVRSFLEGAPFYLSIDVDVIEPAELAAVSAPVRGGIGVALATALIARLFAMQPIAADVTEYNPLRDTRSRRGLKSLAPLMKEVERWLAR